MFKVITLLLCLFLFSCNTIVGGVKGVGRDIKAVTVYSRDALTGNPISDESSNWILIIMTASVVYTVFKTIIVFDYKN